MLISAMTRLDASPDATLKRRSYLWGIPLGVLALGMSYLIAPSSNMQPWDYLLIPSMMVFLVGIWFGFGIKKRDFVVIEIILLAGLGVYFGAKLLLTVLNQNTVPSISELAEVAVWFPAGYTIAFWMFGLRRGRLIAIGYLGLTLVLGLGFHLPHYLKGGANLELFVLAQFYLSNAVLIMILGTFSYTSERQTAVAHSFKELANTDPLTGLYNRRALELALSEALQPSKRDLGVFSVMMLDVDHFKAVNDLYGHDVGDRVLKQLADILKRSVRGSDMAARWGGAKSSAYYFTGRRLRSFKPWPED